MVAGAGHITAGTSRSATVTYEVQVLVSPPELVATTWTHHLQES
jgi:hypothetical protein